MNDKTGTNVASSLRWAWIAVLVAAALAALETRQLVMLIHWERTLPFARDLLPSAIAEASMALAAYLLIIALLLVRRARKWACALGIGWGAIVMGVSLWVLVGPDVKNLWQELLLRAHLTRVLIRYQYFGGSEQWMTISTAGLNALLALGSAKGFADCPRDRLDRGIIVVGIFYAALYYLVMAIVARLVTPH
ncbi:MAG TPA: hypothetical protein VNJ52_08155 [Patescibacteria group bacterium]|nr:hypothetical protein [Patescibacteria group bacterium]